MNQPTFQASASLEKIAATLPDSKDIAITENGIFLLPPACKRLRVSPFTQATVIQDTAGGLDIIVEENAWLTHIIMNGGDLTVRADKQAFYAPRVFSSAVNTCSRLLITLAGPNAETDATALAAGKETGQNTIDLTIIHDSPRTKSSQTIKALADGTADVRVHSLTRIKENASGSVSDQQSRSLLLSEQAGVQAEPQLEVETDDVQATHGAAAGSLDQDALFYLQSRGLSAPECRRLLVRAFLVEALETVEIPALRARLEAAFSL